MASSQTIQLDLILEKLPELVKTQVEAVKGIKIDKVTVWDNGGEGGNNPNSTANFVSGLMKSVPPLNDLFNMAGLNLPSYLKGEDPEIIKTDIVEKKKTKENPNNDTRSNKGNQEKQQNLSNY